jgi:WD40 repeat protein
MITKVSCLECGASLGIKGVVQAVIDCPKCGAQIHTLTVDEDEPEATEPRKRKASTNEPEPRRKPARNVEKADRADDDKPRKKSKATSRAADSDEEPGATKKKNKKKKEADRKKLPLRLAAIVGVGVIAVLIVVLIVNGRKKDDSPSTADNTDRKEPEQPGIVPAPPDGGTNPGKKNPSSKEPKKKPVEKKPPNKEPENPPKVDPPKKEQENPPKVEPKQPPMKEEKPPEDPLALIRTLDGNIDIPKLPPPEQRPVLVLNSTGHSGQMVDSFVTPDNKRLVSVSKDKTIRVWDLSTGETIKTIYMPNGPGEEGDLEAAALAPDGKRLAVGGRTFGRKDRDALVYLISLDKGVIERTMKGHKGLIQCLSFSPNGQWIASGSNDTTVHLFNSTTGGLYGVLDGHEGLVRGVAYHPKEARVATASTDGTARIWITSKIPASSKELKHPKGVVHAVAWSPDGAKLATGGDDGIVRIWSKEGALLKSMSKLEEQESGRVLGGTIYGLCFTKDGKEVIHTGVGAAQTGVFNVESGTHRKIPLHSNTVGSVSISKDGTLAVTAGGNDNEIVLWKIADGSKIKRLAGEGKAIWGLAWSKDGKTLMWGGNNKEGKGFPPMRPVDNAFRIDTFEFGQVAPEKDRVGPTGEFKGAKIQPISRYEIGVFAGDSPICKFGKPERQEAIYSASFLSLGRIVVASAGSLTLVDIAGQRVLGEFQGHNGQQLSIAVPPDREWFATGSIDQTIRFWKPDRFDPFLSIFFAGREWIAWTPEGYYCASPNGERLMGWLVESGQYKLGKFLSASQFRQSLYQPEIIRNLFRVNGDLKYAMALLVKERKKPLEPIMLTQVIPPEVQITAPVPLSETGEIQVNEESIEVMATAKSVGKNPITALRLIVDGRPYGSNGGLHLIPKPQLGEVKNSWRVSLPRGPHSIVVNAYSSVSRGMSPTVEVEQLFGDDKLPNLYMVVVGINDYPQVQQRLKYARTDAQTIVSVLQDKTKEVFGKVEMKLLLDKDGTRANILAGLSWLEKNMTPRDVGLFYFSGHGAKDDDDSFYLCPFDVANDFAKSCVSGDTMKQQLTRIPGRMIAILDTCHSGAAKVSSGRADNLVRDLQNDDCGVIVICASLGDEFSIESGLDKGGLFTLALTEALTGKADYNGDGLIQLNEAFQYTVSRVRETSKDKQHPATTSTARIKPFALTKP